MSYSSYSASHTNNVLPLPFLLYFSLFPIKRGLRDRTEYADASVGACIPLAASPACSESTSNDQRGFTFVPVDWSSEGGMSLYSLHLSAVRSNQGGTCEDSIMSCCLFLMDHVSSWLLCITLFPSKKHIANSHLLCIKLTCYKLNFAMSLVLVGLILCFSTMESLLYICCQCFRYLNTY